MSKLVNVCLILVVTLTCTLPVSAGSLLSSTNRHSAKGCDDYGSCQPDCCRPQIVRPSTYHPPMRARGCGKPDACYQTGCDLDGCCPVAAACVPGADACTPAGPGCAPASLPCVTSCAPLACDDTCCPNGTCPPELAELIQRSQTACHSWDRRDAVHKLGDRYPCCKYPEVMNALVFALNDPDERVRSKAADEIGDQLRASPNCCSPTVLSALKHALGDCDRFVRRQAEEALLAAGYEIVDGCCNLRGAKCDDCCIVAAAPANASNLQVVQSREKSNPVATSAAPRNAVVVNDVTPTAPVAAPVPPPTDAIVPPSPTGVTPVAFERTSAQQDAPIPSSAGAVSGASGSQKSAVPTPPPRRQPLRQTLNNLFNQH